MYPLSPSTPCAIHHKEHLSTKIITSNFVNLSKLHVYAYTGAFVDRIDQDQIA